MTARTTSLLAGLAVLVLTATALLATDAGWLTVLVALLGGGAAMIAASLGSEPAPPPPSPPPPPPPVPPLHAHPEFAPLIDALGVPVLLIDKGIVLAANDAAKTLLGDFIVGADIRSAFRHPGAVDRLTRPPVPAGNGDDSASLMGLGTPDQRWEMRDIALPDDRRLVLLTDHSQRDAIDRMRADFVANASHELRTPLAAILGYVETLLDPEAGRADPVRQRFLSIIDTEARRMQQLVHDLLSMSRVESSRHIPPTDLVAVDRLAARVVDQLRAAGDPRAAAITLDIADDLPLLPGDEAQLSQMLHNIIGNAMKYGRPGTPVRVTVGPVETAMLAVEVADEGDGIAPEHLPRLTERFYRVDNARSRALGGTGLGLAIVRHIVERHRGELGISSDPGIGTRVRVRLPLRR